MKKIYILITLFSFMAVSCDDKIDDLFLDPDGGTFARIDYLFTDAITDVGAGLRIGYSPSTFHLIQQGIGPWMQVLGNSGNDADMMVLSSNSISNSWKVYYVDFMSRVAEMQTIYNDLPEDERADFDVYMNMIKVVRANATSKVTDLYGDMPYSEAFEAREIGGNLFPKFDRQQDIYPTLLNDLKEASAFLSTFSSNGGTIHADISTQDLLNGGDMDKWVKMANSLRLRFAMRISDADPALALSHIQEVANEPLVLTNADNIYVNAEGPNGLNTEQAVYMGRAFIERDQRTYAVDFMVDMMKQANDPRLAYHFNTNEAGEYIGIPVSPDGLMNTEEEVNIENYSRINPELIRDNEYLPGIVVTASEVNFLLAEAAMKGYITGDAQAYYNTGMEESVRFYYDIVALNPQASPSPPDEAELADFVSSSPFAYDGTIEQLATQKWLHFGVLQVFEAYAEHRRLDFPVFPTSTVDNIPLFVPTRVVYPDSEKNFNEESYNAVRELDFPYALVWFDTKRQQE